MAQDTGVELEVARPAAPILTDDEITRLWRIAKALAASGMFKDARQAEQAFAKIVIGRDLGLSPAQSMTGIHIVEGKPEIAAVTLASFVQGSANYDYRIIEHTDERCRIEFLRGSDVLGESLFTMEDADRAGLAKKPGYVAYPRNYLFARAMSNGVKWFCPEVTGGIPVYHEGEIDRGRLDAGDPGEEIKDATVVGGEPFDGYPHENDILAIIGRARNVGHAGLSDVGRIQMLLKGKAPEAVRAWLTEAHWELRQMEASTAEAEVVEEPEAAPEEPEPPDADPVPETGPSPREAERLINEANSLLDEAIVAEEDEDDPEKATSLREQAEELRQAAGPMGEQPELEL